MSEFTIIVGLPSVYAAFSIILTTEGETDTPFFRGSVTDEKYGAEHSSNDEAVFLEAGRSTTVGFDLGIPISPKAAAVSGVSSAQSIGDANEMLFDSHFKTNLFGMQFRQMARGADDVEGAPPYLTITVETSRGQRFSETCEMGE